MKQKKTKTVKRYKIPKRFFEGKRLEIIRILIDELSQWKDSKKVSEEELYHLVDRLNSL